ncbi:MAG: hypothetical protein GY928_16910 [Colwellia sp.]|nr:hypothetical protein [Colwellia sp.]
MIDLIEEVTQGVEGFSVKFNGDVGITILKEGIPYVYYKHHWITGNYISTKARPLDYDEMFWFFKSYK